MSLCDKIENGLGGLKECFRKYRDGCTTGRLEGIDKVFIHTENIVVVDEAGELGVSKPLRLFQPVERAICWSEQIPGGSSYPGDW